MTVRRGIALGLTMTLGLGWSLTDPPAAWALGCAGPAIGPGGPHGSFAGNNFTHTNQTDGARATIEFKNEALCTTAGESDFSSYWAAVVAFPSPNGLNIYQVGIDDCKVNACPAGPTDNVPYYFWAYGREAANGCTAKGPTATYISDAPAQSKVYRVIREIVPGAGAFWRTYIGASQTSSRVASDLDTCWGGVDAAQFANELWDLNAQSGGTSGNKQTFSNVQWYDGSNWVNVTGMPLGGNCHFVDLSTQRCVWPAGSGNLWDSWDTRY